MVTPRKTEQLKPRKSSFFSSPFFFFLFELHPHDKKAERRISNQPTLTSKRAPTPTAADANAARMPLIRRNRTEPVPASRAPHPRPSHHLFASEDEKQFSHLEAERAEFVRCSGMHTPVVRRIVEAVCTKGWSMAHPFSSSSFLIPAFTKGIPEQLEAVCTGHGEIAVYASLFMSIYVGSRLGGFVPPSSKHDDLRKSFDIGYNVGLVSGLINVLVSVFFRASAATMARESDMLVFLAKSRYFSTVNIIVFLVGATVGMVNCLGAALASDRGDFCLDGQ